MSDQIFPLNVDPESPLKPKNNKKKKPTFKQWFNERKRMLGLVLGVCLVTVGAIVYPYLNLGELFKGQVLSTNTSQEEPPMVVSAFKINNKTTGFFQNEMITKVSWEEDRELCNFFNNNDYYRSVVILTKGSETKKFTSKMQGSCEENKNSQTNKVLFEMEIKNLKISEYLIAIGGYQSTESENQKVLSKAFLILRSDDIGAISIPANLSEDQILEGKELTEDIINSINKEIKSQIIELPLSPDTTSIAVDQTPFVLQNEPLQITVTPSFESNYNLEIKTTETSPKTFKSWVDLSGNQTIKWNGYADDFKTIAKEGNYEIVVSKKQSTSNPNLLQQYTKLIEVKTNTTADTETSIPTTTETEPEIKSATIPLLLTSTPNTNSIKTTEAVTYTLKATSTDVFGPSIICFIEYGDGKGEEKLCGPGDAVTFTAHKYTESDTYTAKAGTRVKSGVENIYEIESSLSYTVYSPVASVLLIEPDNLAPKIEDKDEGVKVKFTLTAKNLAGPYDYEIDYGDGEDDSSTDQINDTQTFTHKYDEEGEYEVVAEITDSERVLRRAIYELEIKADYDEEDEDEDEEDDDDDKETNCTNNKDDDGDGEKDYEDSDCKIPESQKIVISDARVSRSPFNPSVNASSILYKLNRDSLVTIEVFDSSKKKVATLLDGKLKQALTTTGAQANQAEWFYGKVNNDPVGQALPDGTYTYTITAANPKYATIKDTKSSTVIVNSKDGVIAGDWEQTGATSTSGTGTTGSTSASQTSSTRTAQTSSTKTALSTSTNQTSNLAALTMQNNPPGTTAGTGPEMLIYLLLPAVSAFALTRKK